MARMMGHKGMLSMRPCDVRDGDVFAVKVVAVAGHAGDWAAYVGPSSWSDARVVQQGQKLTREQVGSLFHVMSCRAYRG